ncbi:MAG: hypothetical protein Q9227_006741 [Pyrenula ochraceoflavens]
MRDRDPNRVPTPVSGRGDRKSHLFPHRDVSPLRLSQSPPEPRLHYDDLSVPFSSIQNPSAPSQHSPTTAQRNTSSLSPRFQSFTIKMHTDRSSYYTPSSPLSPNMNPSLHPVAPQPATHTRQRSHHSPKSAKSSLRATGLGSLPRFHPARFESAPPINPSSTTTSSNPVADSPKAMRRYQRELLAKADYSSRLAASPFGAKPDSPRLDPLGSPGPVTPLALERGGDSDNTVGDYFLSGAAATSGSPAVSPKVEGGMGGDKAGEMPMKIKAGSPKITGRELTPRR